MSPAMYAPVTAPVTVAHSRIIATRRFVHPSRTKATLAPALVATTAIRLAPTATCIGMCREDNQCRHDKNAAAQSRKRTDESGAQG